MSRAFMNSPLFWLHVKRGTGEGGAPPPPPWFREAASASAPPSVAVPPTCHSLSMVFLYGVPEVFRDRRTSGCLDSPPSQHLHPAPPWPRNRGG